jgi:hypothetical protein
MADLIPVKERNKIYRRTRHRYLETDVFTLCSALRQVLIIDFPDINRRLKEKDWPKAFPELWKHKPEGADDKIWWPTENTTSRIVVLHKIIKET